MLIMLSTTHMIFQINFCYSSLTSSPMNEALDTALSRRLRILVDTLSPWKPRAYYRVHNSLLLDCREPVESNPYTHMLFFKIRFITISQSIHGSLPFKLSNYNFARFSHVSHVLHVQPISYSLVWLTIISDGGYKL
jgi:hypothetical protein